jgi:energy-coupling factor transport system ATP-binding protein
MAVIFDNVKYIYNKRTPFENVGVEGITFLVDKGFYAIIGKTGSGKSTVLQLSNGILLPDDGKVIVDDINTKISKYSFKIKKLIGLSFQYPEDQFFEDSVFKEVAFAPKNFGIEDYNLQLRVKWAMELSGLNFEKFKDRHPLMLSGGQRRKVALASVISSRPKYLFLDEPTAGLDPESEISFLNTLKKLVETQGVTVMISTHNLDIVDAYCDKVFVVNDGKIVIEGKPSDVFSNFEKLKIMGLFPPIKYVFKNKFGGLDVC